MVKLKVKDEGNLKSGNPDIFNAAVNNDPVEMDLALAQGQRLDEIQYGTGFTPVHLACINRSTEFLQEAVKHPFDPWVRDVNLRLAIDHAFAHKLKDAHGALLKKMYAPGWDREPEPVAQLHP